MSSLSLVQPAMCGDKMTLSESNSCFNSVVCMDKFSKDVFSYSKTSKQAPKTLPDFKFAKRDLVSKQGPLDVLIRYMGL